MNGTGVKIVDTSAVASIMFDEPEADEVILRLRGAVLVAPALLQFELVNVCVTKLRRHPELRDSMLRGLEIYTRLMIEPIEVDSLGIFALAERFGLTGYDASYLRLAQRLRAELVTLDQRLARAAATLRPG
jgi:predicted nucleic acid-binding protein